MAEYWPKFWQSSVTNNILIGFLISQEIKKVAMPLTYFLLFAEAIYFDNIVIKLSWSWC